MYHYNHAENGARIGLALAALGVLVDTTFAVSATMLFSVPALLMLAAIGSAWLRECAVVQYAQRLDDYEAENTRTVAAYESARRAYLAERVCYFSTILLTVASLVITAVLCWFNLIT